MSIVEELRRHGFGVLSAHYEESFGGTFPLPRPEQVVTRDFQWMTECHAFVAVLPDHPSGGVWRSDGLHVELGWAACMGKPVVLVHSRGSLGDLSHLVLGMRAMTHVETIELDRVCADPAVLIHAVETARRAAGRAGWVPGEGRDGAEPS